MSFEAALVEVPLTLTPGVIDVDDLQLGAEVERGRALLEGADARGLDAAEGDVRLAAGGGRVDVRHAGLDLVHEAEDAGRILCEDGRGEPELAVVGDLQGFVEVLDAQDGEEGAEDLLARDAHVGRDAVEDRRLDEETLAQARAGRRPAARYKLRAVLARHVHEGEDGLELARVNNRADLRLRAHAVAEPERFGALADAPDELV